MAKDRFSHLAEELDLDERWLPLLDYLSTFGFKDSHFIQMYERHMPSLQINKSSAQERLEFLLSVGVKHKDIRKIILRQPQLLEYTVENNLKSHVTFLTSLGIPDSRIGQIITAAPSLFSYSVENSLKPTVTYLLEEVGIEKNDLAKVVQLSPQILVQRINTSWTTRFNFLTRELGAPRDSIVKMVRKHPQLLHYSIEDGLLPRINFFRSIGMRNSEIVKVLTSITQVSFYCLLQFISSSVSVVGCLTKLENGGLANFSQRWFFYISSPILHNILLIHNRFPSITDLLLKISTITFQRIISALEWKSSMFWKISHSFNKFERFSWTYIYSQCLSIAGLLSIT